MRLKGKLRKRIAGVIVATALTASFAVMSHGSAITGGGTATPGDSDFVVRVEKYDDMNHDMDYSDENERGTCTGTLIHPMWVLTAHHCVPDTDANISAGFGRMEVRIGNQDFDRGGEFRRVTQVRRNPEYLNGDQNGAHKYGHNDIALLRLERPSYMRPVKFATPAYSARWTTDPATNAVYGVATGWGRTTANGTLATKIQRLTVRLKASSLDDAGVPTINLDEVANRGRGPCPGDSGGPLLLRADNDELRQVGVVKGTDCDGSGNYSDVANTGQNRDFIRQQIPDLDNPKPANAYESWTPQGAPVSGGGCGSTGGCQTYRTFDYSPAVATNGLWQRVFVVTNQTVYTRTRNGNGMWDTNEWERVDFPRRVNAKPAAVMTKFGDVDLFVRGDDNKLYWKKMRDSVWENGATLLGGTLYSGPAAAVEYGSSLAGGSTSPIVHVFVKGYDGGAWETTIQNGNASSWRARGGKLTSELAAASMSGNRVDVFARCTDNAGNQNKLCQLVVYGTSGSAEGWYVFQDGTLTSGPAVASKAQGFLDVFVRGYDNAVWHKAWDGYRWTAWDNRGGVATSDPAAAEAGWEDGVDVFVRGYDNALWSKLT